MCVFGEEGVVGRVGVLYDDDWYVVCCGSVYGVVNGSEGILDWWMFD